MHEIDRSFRAKRVEAGERRARTLRRRIVVAAFGAVAIGLGGAGFLAFRHWAPAPEVTRPMRRRRSRRHQQKKPVFVNPIIDLAGDPLIIRLGDASETNTKLREVAVTPELKQPALSDGVEILSDVMLSSSQRIMALAIEPRGFCLLPVAERPRAVRGSASQPAADEPAVDEPCRTTRKPSRRPGRRRRCWCRSPDRTISKASEELAAPEEEPIRRGGRNSNRRHDRRRSTATGEIGEPDADLGAGWGETVSEGQEALPSFKKTAIDDTTTVHLVKPEIDRFRQIEDFTVSVKGERPLDSIVAEYGFSADEGKSAAEAAKRLIGVETLGERSVVGLRGYRPDSKGSRLRLVQVSINSPDKNISAPSRLPTTARSSRAPTRGSTRTCRNMPTARREVAQPQSYRLLDAIYSTATRNNVPSSVTGEAIMLISRAFDLQAIATKDDRLVLAFAKDGPRRGRKFGPRALCRRSTASTAISSASSTSRSPAPSISCMSEKDATHSVTVTNGMVTPVNGVLTSTFGPRRHPILKSVRLHKGVDWRAPVGTPIMAAFDGTVEFAGDGKGYGNVIRIAHGGGKATAYAHMSRFEHGHHGRASR